MHEKKTFAEHLACVVRILSIPPVMITLLILAVFLLRDDVFRSAAEAWWAVFFLALFPSMAYPVSWAVPDLRKKGREGQRNLAFLFSAAGYLGGFLYGALHVRRPEQMLIFTVYLFSLVLLALCNRGLKRRASGHACSVTGTVILAGWQFGMVGAAVGLLCYCVIFWSSMRAKRHTPAEFLLGTAVCAAAALIGWLLVISGDCFGLL
ncbi:MAG: hypothetical protein IJT76_06575 [Clostridia bacterium]|nr:hypothetical protein [Clostridia bacterium]